MFKRFIAADRSGEEAAELRRALEDYRKRADEAIRRLEGDQQSLQKETSQLAKREKKGRIFDRVIAIVGVLGIGFAGLSACESRRSAEASSDSAENSRYEFVYAHQLDLWSLAAGNADLAPYLVGGRRPSAPADGDALPAGAVTPAEKEGAVLHAALTYALDFYTYVWVEKVERDDIPENPLSAQVERPKGWGEAEWDDWSTWASTIRQGFGGAPGMCDRLSLDA